MKRAITRYMLILAFMLVIFFFLRVSPRELDTNIAVSCPQTEKT